MIYHQTAMWNPLTYQYTNYSNCTHRQTKYPPRTVQAPFATANPAQFRKILWAFILRCFLLNISTLIINIYTLQMAYLPIWNVCTVTVNKIPHLCYTNTLTPVISILLRPLLYPSSVAIPQGWPLLGSHTVIWWATWAGGLSNDYAYPAI